MTIDEFLPIILYILLSILVIVLIVFIIRLFKTLNKIDATIDDLNMKMEKINGVFEIVDRTTGAMGTIADKVIGGIGGLISKFFKNKKEKDEDYE